MSDIEQNAVNLKLTKKQNAAISLLKSHDYKVTRLINLYNSFKFNVGDVCRFYDTESNNGYDESFRLVKYDTLDTYQRFVCVSKDESTNNYFFIKVAENGELDKDSKPTSTAEKLYEAIEFGYELMAYFEVDPLQVESIILGENFNIKSILDEEVANRNRLIDMKKKTAFIPKNLKQANNFFKGLSKGDKFYWHENSKYGWENDDLLKTYVIQSRPRKYRVDKLKQKIPFCFDLHLSRFPEEELLRFKVDGGALMCGLDYIGKVLYKEEPITIQETK